MSVPLLQEMRTAWRSLARTPWFTATAVLMLAAGLGLSMYMFGAINGFLLKPLPFMQAERLMYVAYEDRDEPGEGRNLPLHDFVEIRAAQTRFEDLAGFYEGTINLGDGERPERYDGVFATASMFTELGMGPLLGRVPEAADNVPGAAPVAVISHALWLNRFNGDPGVVGRSVRLNGKPGRIIGVMPPRFRFPRKHDVWMALPLDVSGDRARAMSLQTFGRLREDASAAEARAELQAQLGRINAAHPALAVAERAMLRPYAEELISDQTRVALYTMFAAVLLVLLIACANVANLMVARGIARRRELAIRGALGAGGRRLMLQVLAESLMIVAAASAIGWCGALLGGELTMQAIRASDDPPAYWVDFTLDGPGVTFSLAVALLSALAAALLPALEAARTPAAQAMRSGGAGAIGRGAGLGKALVVMQVAVCMGLLVGAGLTVRSVIKMQTHDLGFRPDGVLTGRVALFPGTYPDAEARRRFFDSLQRRLAQVPGVDAAALASALPMMDMGRYDYLIEGQEPMPAGRMPGTWAVWVTPEYFDTFGIGLLSGRGFGPQDSVDAPPVAIVSASFARNAWPGLDPVGRRVKLSPAQADAVWASVIGVVPDTMHAQFNDGNSPVAVFVPLAQSPASFVSFALRTRGDPYALSDAVRDAVASVDADLPVYWLRSMRDWLEISMWEGRLMMRLFGTFGLFALLLAMSGIYAVLAHAVGQRTREIGVRRALGARDDGILALLLRQGGMQLGLGLVLGFALALGFGRLLANLLFDLPGFDPPTFALVACLLVLVSLVAAWLPARRALRVEPMAALRSE